MPSIAMPLNQIARARACSSADHRAFLPTDQSTSNRSGDSADDRAFSLTVVVPIRTPMREALRGGTEKYKHK
jgi:hypothetical protein